MEKCCKNCSKHLSCNYFVPFPERGCSDFIPGKKKSLFAVFCHNTETGNTIVLNIFDDINFARAELQEFSENICKRPSSNIHLYIRPCSFNYTKTLADDVLMSIVNSVAQYLLIAERGFKKGCFKQETFEKSKRWFEFVYTACRRGAAILDVINED